MELKAKEEMLLVFEKVFEFYHVVVSGNLIHLDGVSYFIQLALGFIQLRNDFDGNFQM